MSGINCQALLGYGHCPCIPARSVSLKSGTLILLGLGTNVQFIILYILF